MPSSLQRFSSAGHPIWSVRLSHGLYVCLLLRVLWSCWCLSFQCKSSWTDKTEQIHWGKVRPCLVEKGKDSQFFATAHGSFRPQQCSALFAATTCNTPLKQKLQHSSCLSILGSLISSALINILVETKSIQLSTGTDFFRLTSGKSVGTGIRKALFHEFFCCFLRHFGIPEKSQTERPICIKERENDFLPLSRNSDTVWD